MMALLESETELDRMRNISDSRRIHPKPTRPDLVQKNVPLDPSARVSSLLSEIANYLAKTPRNLPAEARRLLQCSKFGDLLHGLDLLLHDQVLSAYLKSNPACLRWLRHLFSSRHRYLLHPDLKAEEGEDARNTIKHKSHARPRGDKIFVSQVGPFSETFKSSHDSQTLQDQGRGIVSWAPECSYGTFEDSRPGGIVKDCVDAFNNFEPVTTWQAWAQNFHPQEEYISSAELELASKIYALQQLVATPTLESLKIAVNAMPNEFREFLYGENADKTIIEDLARRIWANEMAHRIRTEGTIELKLEFECPTPAEEELPPRHVGVTKAMALALSAAARVKKMQSLGVATVEEYGRYHYKGSTIPTPQILLPWAINFLADEDVDRTVGWAEKFAELTEYLAHLHHSYAFEDWGHQMKEAVGMLKTHWLFEKYYYGAPELKLEFPVNMWPKESKRLPRLPGPDIELRRESDDQRDFKGPRLLLHLDLTSAHDEQYGMPTDVLKRCYLQPFQADALNHWNYKNLPANSQPQNLAQLENKYYEGFMSNGIVQLAEFLNGKIGRFHYNPDDTIGSGQRKTAKRTSLDSFAMFRGTKRAALQLCLNVFDSAENRDMCSPWRTLNLPPPQAKQKPDAGIIFPSPMIKDAPSEKESRDPWAYTRAHRRYRREQAAWAAWTREHALKMAWKLKLTEARGGTIMELPNTWKGVHPPGVMDVKMKRRYELMRRCEIIRQSLKRAARRAPRPFISGLLEMLDAGLRGREWQDLGLGFAEHELSVERSDRLALIRPTEAAWLEYICQPSRNRPIQPKGPLSRVDVILISRVKDILQDISPCSLFSDTEPRSMDEFLSGLNAAVGGPVKRHRFTRSEVMSMAPTLDFMKVLRVSRQGKELQFARPKTEFHPEVLIKWPSVPEEQVEETGRQTEEEDEEALDAADHRSVASSRSTHLTIPASIDDFTEYPENFPRRKDVLSLEDFIHDPSSNPADQERTDNFFRCLAYRLGVSLRDWKAIYRQDVKTARDPALRQHNADFLDNTIRIWSEETMKRPNNPRKNPRKTGTHRETLTLPDIVKMAEPENFQEQWMVGDWPDESAAATIVRKNLVRELCENKTMIWPLQLPYDRRTMEYQVPSPNPKLSLPGEYVGKEKSVIRREPIWTFGHPSRKPRAHLFWDMNNWPLSTLSREIRERVQGRGPKKQDKPAGQEELDSEEQPHSMKQPRAMPYWKTGEDKRVFVPGPAEYLAGDTPLQRKVIEQRIRQRFERRRPRKRGWTERIADAFLGGDKTKLDGDFALPDVDPAHIPESRPAKRPRLNESFESPGSSQDPLLAVGPSSFSESMSGPLVGAKAPMMMEKGLTVTGADNVVLRHEPPDSAKGMKLVGKLGIRKGRASVTYVVPDGRGEDEDPPLILYYKPNIPS